MEIPIIPEFQFIESGLYMIVISVIGAAAIIYWIWPTDLAVDAIEIPYPKRKQMSINKARKIKKGKGHINPYPNGWFYILPSARLPVGAVKEIYVFEQELVVWRGKNGTAYVADAYCPHLGAHLGVEGEVRGNCIQCPFHHWQFDGEKGGKLARIPYSQDYSKLGNVGLKMWISTEKNGFIFIWHHSEGLEPSWEIEEIPEFKQRVSSTLMEMEQACDTHDFFENTADTTHFDCVHGSFPTNGITLRGSPVPLWLAKQNEFHGVWTQDKEQSHVGRFTYHWKMNVAGLSLPGGKGAGRQYGPGLLVNGYTMMGFWIWNITVGTPIDPYSIRCAQLHLWTSWSTHLFSPYMRSLHVIQFVRDAIITNRKIHRGKDAPLTKEEVGVKNFRRFYNQFYPKAINKLE